MLYLDAVKNLMGGKFVTRNTKSWEDEGAYLCYLPGITHFLRVTVQPKPQVIPWACDVENSQAEDWVVVDPREIINALKEEPKLAEVA